MTPSEQAMRDSELAKKAEINRYEEIFFNGLVNVDNPKLPERIFLANILPLLEGSLKPEQAYEVLKYWVAVAGSYMRNIDIIDAKGNTLFVLPSIIDTEAVNLDSDGPRLLDIVTKADLLGNNLEVLKTRYLQEHLVNKNFIRSTEVNPARAAAFKDILTRYGYAPAKPAKAEKAAEDSVEDDFIYD
jgi:hypothetical protein